MPGRILSAAVISLICAVPFLLRAQQPPVPTPTGDPQRPVFRGGAYFVTVDVYPTLNGRILTDLTEATLASRPRRVIGRAMESTGGSRTPIRRDRNRRRGR